MQQELADSLGGYSACSKRLGNDPTNRTLGAVRIEALSCRMALFHNPTTPPMPKKVWFFASAINSEATTIIKSGNNRGGSQSFTARS